MLTFKRPQIPDVMPGMCPNLNPTPESPGHDWLIHSPVYSRTIIHVYSVENRPQVTYRYEVNTSGFREGEHEFMGSYPALKPLYRPRLPNATMMHAWRIKVFKITVLLHKHQRTRERGRLSLVNRVGCAEP